MFHILETMPKIVNCRIGQFFIIQKEILGSERNKNLAVSNTYIDTSNLQVVSLSNVSWSQAAFANMHDANTTIITQQFLSLPILL